MEDLVYKPAAVSKPSHTILELCYERGWKWHEAAEVIAWPGFTYEEALGTIVGNRPIDERAADALERAFGTSKEFWLNRQRHYDEGIAQGLPDIDIILPDEDRNDR